MSRFFDAIESIVNAIVGAKLDYLARYPATVKLQSVDGSLHVEPDDARLPGMTGVRMLPCVPGLSALVPPQSRVLIAFESGDPKKPIAEIWSSGTPLTLAINSAISITLTAPTVNVVGAMTATSVSAGGVDSSAASTAISATTGNIEIDSTLGGVKLGPGLAGVARIGDAVVVDPGTHVGTITTGSVKVFA